MRRLWVQSHSSTCGSFTVNAFPTRFTEQCGADFIFNKVLRMLVFAVVLEMSRQHKPIFVVQNDRDR
jgi:hypothetical protein